MEWPGVRDDLSKIGAGLEEAWNVSYRRGDSLIRRTGLDDRIDINGTSMAEINDPFTGLNYLLHNPNTDEVYGVKASDKTVTTLLSGLGAGRQGDFAETWGAVYFTDSLNPMFVFYDATNPGEFAGIDPPPDLTGSTAAGNATDGTHLIRLRYRNTATGYFSNPSATDTVTTTSEKITVSVGGGDVSADGKVDQILLEATAAGGTVYYVCDTIPNEAGTLELDIPDTELINLEVLGDAVGNATPPLVSTIHAHRGRLFGIGLDDIEFTNVTFTNGSKTITGGIFNKQMVGLSIAADGDTTSYVISEFVNTGTLTLSADYAGVSGTKDATMYRAADDLLFWTGPTLPEGWDTVNQARRIFQGRADRPKQMFSYYDDLMIAGKRSLFRINYDSDPATGRVELIPGDLGVYNNRCTVEAEGRMYGFGAGGAWVMDGLIPRIISEPVYLKIEDRVDATQSDDFFATYDPDERCVQFHYTAVGDTLPMESIAYEIDSGNLSLRSYRQALIGGFTTIDGNNVARSFVSDENGYSWFLKEGVFDGVPSVLGSGSVTATTGGTTTVVNVTETLPTSPDDLEGAMVYRPATDETRLISSNTSSSFTVSSAFATVPTDGEAFWIGSIQLSFKTKWIGKKGERDNRSRTNTVGLRFVPDDSGSDIDLYTFLDFATSAETVSSNATDVYPEGVIVNNGDNFSTVETSISKNSDGYVEMPLTSEMQSHVQFEVQQYEPGGEFELVDFMPVVNGEVKNLQ